MTDEQRQRLAEILAREHAATAGPWYEPYIYRLLRYSYKCPMASGRDDDWREAEKEGEALPNDRDSGFIANARADVPWMAGVIEEQAREIERLRGDVEAVAGQAERNRVTANQVAGQRDEAEAEVARLRAALGQYADYKNWSGGGHDYFKPHGDGPSIAEAALSAGGQGADAALREHDSLEG